MTLWVDGDAFRYDSPRATNNGNPRQAIAWHPTDLPSMYLTMDAAIRLRDALDAAVTEVTE